MWRIMAALAALHGLSLLAVRAGQSATAPASAPIEGASADFESDWLSPYVTMTPTKVLPPVAECPQISEDPWRCAAIVNVSRSAPCSADMPCCMPGDQCVVNEGESFCMPNEPEDIDYAADSGAPALV